MIKMISKETRRKKNELLCGSNPMCIAQISGNELPHWQGKHVFFSIRDYGKFGISLCVSGPRGAPYGECFILREQFPKLVEKIQDYTKKAKENE